MHDLGLTVDAIATFGVVAAAVMWLLHSARKPAGCGTCDTSSCAPHAVDGEQGHGGEHGGGFRRIHAATDAAGPLNGGSAHTRIVIDKLSLGRRRPDTLSHL